MLRGKGLGPLLSLMSNEQYQEMREMVFLGGSFNNQYDDIRDPLLAWMIVDDLWKGCLNIVWP